MLRRRLVASTVARVATRATIAFSLERFALLIESVFGLMLAPLVLGIPVGVKIGRCACSWVVPAIAQLRLHAQARQAHLAGRVA